MQYTFKNINYIIFESGVVNLNSFKTELHYALLFDCDIQ